MVGFVAHIDPGSIHEVRLNWKVSFDNPSRNLEPRELRYVLFCWGKALLLGKVSGVEISPNDPSAPWRLTFSAFLKEPYIPGLILTGPASHKTMWLNAEQEERAEQLLSADDVIKFEEPPKLHLTIQEAVEALSRRYDIDPKNISISLHN